MATLVKANIPLYKSITRFAKYEQFRSICCLVGYPPESSIVIGVATVVSCMLDLSGVLKIVGYVIDNRLGNTNKLGALYGILQGIDIFVPHPQPGTLGWKVGIAEDSTVNFVK